MEQKIWWYAVNNEQKGPISYDELNLLINQNFINSDTFVWKQGMPNWIKFSEINAQPAANIPPSPPQSNPSYFQPNSSTPQPGPNTPQPSSSSHQPGSITPQANPSYSQPSSNTPQPNPNTQQFNPSYHQPNISQTTPHPQAKTTDANNRLNFITDFYYKAEFEKMISSNESYKGKWNWWAFFFNWVWCFTKGLWQYGLIIILIVVGLQYFMPLLYANLFSFAAGILFGMRGNYFYYNLKMKNKQLF